jgi:hypothetical protein
MNYTKLFHSILDSSVWSLPDGVRIVWITLLSMADLRGEIRASLPGIAHRARVSIEVVREALSEFLGPDEYSTSPEHEGRRIEAIEGGWRLLNWERYRYLESDDDRREKACERKRAQREREAQRAVKAAEEKRI